LAVRQALIGVHVLPSPEYPLVHAQVLVPAPVEVHWAAGSQPPLLMLHSLMPVQVVPFPV